MASEQPRSVARKRVVFDRTMRANKQPRFDEEEYEGIVLIVNVKDFYHNLRVQCIGIVQCIRIVHAVY